jgi:hypothetical protein
MDKPVTKPLPTPEYNAEVERLARLIRDAVVKGVPDMPSDAGAMRQGREIAMVILADQGVVEARPTRAEVAVKQCMMETVGHTAFGPLVPAFAALIDAQRAEAAHDQRESDARLVRSRWSSNETAAYALEKAADAIRGNVGNVGKVAP